MNAYLLIFISPLLIQASQVEASPFTDSFYQRAAVESLKQLKAPDEITASFSDSTEFRRSVDRWTEETKVNPTNLSEKISESGSPLFQATAEELRRKLMDQIAVHPLKADLIRSLHELLSNPKLISDQDAFQNEFAETLFDETSDEAFPYETSVKTVKEMIDLMPSERLVTVFETEPCFDGLNTWMDVASENSEVGKIFQPFLKKTLSAMNQSGKLSQELEAFQVVNHDKENFSEVMTGK